MSHFPVLVIGSDPEAQLQPFHEFECTGTDDEYVVDVDETAEFRAEYSKHVDDYESFEAFVSAWHGIEHTVPVGSDPDLGGDGKYGYAEVSLDGKIVRVIRRTNPNAKWDWWVIGGRWCGFFPLKPGAEGLAGKSAGAAHARRADAGTADQLKIESVDFDRARHQAAARASATFDRWEALVAEHGKAKPWSEVRDSGLDICAARKAYNSQPLAAAANKAMGLRLSCWIDDLGYDRDAYVRRCVDQVLVPHAVVKNGKWVEKGDMGWFGISDDHVDQEDWNKQIHALYEDLPPDTLLTLVDCHI